MIRDQGDRQLDKISRMNLSDTKATDFYDGSGKERRDLVVRAKEETNDNTKKGKIFTVTISGNDFDFNSYTNLSNFGSNLFTKNISLDETIEEQKEILDKINDLKKNFRPDKIGRPYGKDKKDRADKFIENAKKLYKTSGDIIDAFKKLETEQNKETEETEEAEETEQTEETEESKESGDDTDLGYMGQKMN